MDANRRLQVDIISFAAASGHKSAADALKHGLTDRFPDSEIRVVDLEDILKCQTRILGWVYRLGITYFNWCMRREQYFFFALCIRASVVFARLNTRCRPLRFLLRWTASFWKDRTPDVIVSVTPMMHTIVYEAARLTNPNVHCITIPVDYCEMVPGYWFQPKIQQEYLLGCERLAKQAFEAGVSLPATHHMSGMVIDPRFYDTEPIDRTEFLESLNLDPNLPTGVISFGGQGTINVMRCTQRIAEAGIAVNLICLCGRNEKLRADVQSLSTPYPVAALGFSADPPVTVHRIADFLIGKPGTMTLTESLITKTPFIFIKSTGLDIVQGANENWVLEQGVGVMAETPDAVDRAVLQVLNNSAMQERIEASQHRGIFDAVDIIHQIIEGDRQNCSDENAVPTSDLVVGVPSTV